MKTSEFDYNLPEELIATEPSKRRDESRLLVLDKLSGGIEDKRFYNIVEYLNPGDVLVLNNSKVFPARLFAKKKGSGGRVEVFLHKRTIRGSTSKDLEVEPLIVRWECMLGGRSIKPGLELVFDEGLEAKIIKQNENVWELDFNMAPEEMMSVVERIGQVPLPPYIKTENRKQTIDDRVSYQTVYADDEKRGSVAAPTAGLHFTEGLLDKIKEKGVVIKYITLHVGMGTFAPVKAENIEEHKMHSEFAEVGADVVESIRRAKKSGNKVISVGTTSTRTLEFFKEDILSSTPPPCPKEGVGGWSESKAKPHYKSNPIRNQKFEIRNLSASVDLFIYPGYEFKVIDGMITNFHLPKSSLIMLVSALAGKENIDKAYKHAIEEKYRFYSYGDAMLIS